MQTVDAREIHHFQKDSLHWWDSKGPFAPLHRMNPARLKYIRGQMNAHFGFDEADLAPCTGLEILDLGCGGGLVCEPMARLGSHVTGVDADREALLAAQAHAQEMGLNDRITYSEGSSDSLVCSPTRYDVVLALEIAEHVANLPLFVEQTLSLAKKGGLVIFSTLNRTPRSLLLGKIAAEYILGWVPKGTHDWNKFIRPAELASHVRACDWQVWDTCGVVYSPLSGEFSLSKTDLGINYFLTAR